MLTFKAKGKKVETNMDPIFEHPVFDSAREKIKRFIGQLEKPQETLENSLYTCFKCGSNNVFLLQNRAGLLTKERLCSMSAEIVIINGETEICHMVNATDFRSKLYR